jgi:Relaxase/Mobilisation nuclease domain
MCGCSRKRCVTASRIFKAKDEKVAMKSPQKSRFGKLVTYLLDPQGKKKTRVGEVVITNCVSTDTTWAVREIAATQWLNTRAKSPRTYHLIISLRDGANPDAQTLRMIEERFCNALGYAEHQRVSVVHHDTDNVHIHVAINKIHPRTLTLHTPIRDFITLKICGSSLRTLYPMCVSSRKR